MTIFGVPWNELKLAHVRAFLSDAGAEPLLWEAKGIRADKGEIRKQVCGFANSHEGGFLIIGASEEDHRWNLEGVDFPDEPPIWISNIIGGGAVAPYPDGLDIRSFSTTAGCHVAVVWVPSAPVPPCNTHGVVYERVSGKTISVREPLRLGALFQRGDAAKAGAEARAKHTAVAAMTRGRGHPSHADTHTQFGLGIAATGYRPDISSRLFTPSFESGAISSMSTVLTHDILAARYTAPIPEVAQDSRTFETRPHHHELGLGWSVRVTWDGSVGIYWVQGGRQRSVSQIVDGPFREAWACAEEILSMLQPQGPRYLSVAIAGGSFDPNTRDLPQWGQEGKPTVTARGPVDPGPNDLILASIERELRRAIGEMAYEPECS